MLLLVFLLFLSLSPSLTYNKQVLETKPLTFATRPEIIICTLPAEGPFGDEAENNPFKNVKFKMVNSDGSPVDRELKVLFASEGRLGTLHGGLLRTEDFRRAKSSEDVQSMPKTCVETQIAELDRPGPTHLTWKL